MIQKETKSLALISLSLYENKHPFHVFQMYFSTIEDYSSTSFDIIEILKAFGNFLGVFLGAFALGSAMGCATALVSLELELGDVLSRVAN